MSPRPIESRACGDPPLIPIKRVMNQVVESGHLSVSDIDLQGPPEDLLALANKMPHPTDMVVTVQNAR